MNNATIRSFGVIIAFLLPGFIATIGVSHVVPTVEQWLEGGTGQQATVGGMVFATVFSLWMGIFFSTIRWLVVDTIHHHTGLIRSKWNLRELQANFEAYQLVEESHYRFYQFYGNSFCAIIFSYLTPRVDGSGFLSWGTDLAILFVLAVLFVGSRDSLKKYYERAGLMLTPH